jgi:hypothetical protein
VIDEAPTAAAVEGPPPAEAGEPEAATPAEAEAPAAEPGETENPSASE